MSLFIRSVASLFHKLHDTVAASVASRRLKIIPCFYGKQLMRMCTFFSTSRLRLVVLAATHQQPSRIVCQVMFCQKLLQLLYSARNWITLLLDIQHTDLLSLIMNFWLFFFRCLWGKCRASYNGFMFYKTNTLSN